MCCFFLEIKCPVSFLALLSTDSQEAELCNLVSCSKFDQPIKRALIDLFISNLMQLEATSKTSQLFSLQAQYLFFILVCVCDLTIYIVKLFLNYKSKSE